MKVRIIGGGWYGCHLALALQRLGADVELWESADELFSGASGANPARLHKGFHYPRSRLTRAACLDHAERFAARYGFLTQGVPVNIYAVAANDSLVDFGTYRQVLAGEVEFVTIDRTDEFGLDNVEGALLTGERHINVRLARAFFASELAGRILYSTHPLRLEHDGFDWTIDCTFCAYDAEAIDRYEPCVVGILRGPTDKAVTVMDGPFPSIYPWDEERGLLSLTSASLTPLSKTCRTWADASEVLSTVGETDGFLRVHKMLDQMARYWPAAPRIFQIETFKTAIRAMPKSGADARLVDIVQTGERVLRVRAGKIDAVFRAEDLIRERLGL